MKSPERIEGKLIGLNSFNTLEVKFEDDPLMV